MKISEIRELTNEELAERIEVENHSISPLADNSQIKKLRHDIARMKGELTQRNK